MRLTTTAFVLVGGLALGDFSYAEGTVSPSPAPQPTAPVGHRQPRPSNTATSPAAGNPSPGAPVTSPIGSSDQDERLNRILNGICRGC